VQRIGLIYFILSWEIYSPQKRCKTAGTATVIVIYFHLHVFKCETECRRIPKRSNQALSLVFCECTSNTHLSESFSNSLFEICCNFESLFIIMTVMMLMMKMIMIIEVQENFQ
jgi:hypothetical protein